MNTRILFVIIVYLLLGNTAYLSYGQIAISQQKTEKLTLEKIIEADTLVFEDSTQILNYFKPLNQPNNTIYKALYQSLVANALSKHFDELSRTTQNWYNESIKTAEISGNTTIELWTKMNYVERLYHYRQITFLPPVLIDVIELIQTIPQSQIVNPCNTYMHLGWIMQTFNDLEASYKYLTTALKFTNNCPKAEARILNSIGHYFLYKDSFVLAEKYFDETYKKAESIKDYSRMAKALGDQARLLQKQGQLTKAIELVKKDLYYSQVANDSKNTMFASILLAKYELANNNKQSAKKALEEAEKIAITKQYYNVSELEIVKLKLDLIDPNAFDEELILRRKLSELEEKIKLTDGENNIVRTNWVLQKQKFQSKLDKEKESKENQSIIFSIVIAIVIITLIYASIWFLKYNKRQKKKNIQVQESERLRIASDLHDNIINKLTVIRLKTAMQFDPDEIDNLLGNAIDDSRRMSHNLLPPTLDSESLEVLIQEQCSHWQSNFKIEYNYENNKNIIFDSQIKLHIIRITQEVIQNAFKHAKASKITLDLLIQEKSLTLKIQDNGIGFDTESMSKGIGLQNINSRSKFIAATYNFQSIIGSGTTFSLIYVY